MYEAAAVTTEASQLWFTAYVFLLTVFCNNLLVGVVMAQYGEIDTVESPRLYTLLSTSFSFGPRKQTKVMNAMLKLNYNLRKYTNESEQDSDPDDSDPDDSDSDVSPNENALGSDTAAVANENERESDLEASPGENALDSDTDTATHGDSLSPELPSGIVMRNHDEGRERIVVEAQL